MQLTALFFGTLVALSTGASAATASVHNKCSFPIYVQSVPNNNAGPAGPVKRIAPHTGVFKQPLGGSAIRISNSASESGPLTMGYAVSDGTVYYSLSNAAGNPFAGYRNKLSAGKAGCPAFNCAPNDAGCYSGTLACPTSSLTAVICA